MPELLNGSRINERLAELDLLPEKFASRIQISEGYFRNLRNGADKCSRQTAYRIARGLALSVDEVVLATVHDGRRGPAAGKRDTETKEEPTHPTRRQDTEQTTGPKRADGALKAAS